MAKYLTLFLVLVLFVSCNDMLISSSEKAEKLRSSVKTTDVLKMELNITSKGIENLEDVEAEFKLKNISGEEIVYGFPSGCQFGYTIVKDQNTLFDSRKNLGCTGALTQLKLKPGQSKTFPISLDRFDIDKKPDKGTHELQAFLLEGHTDKISASFIVQ